MWLKYSKVSSGVTCTKRPFKAQKGLWKQETTFEVFHLNIFIGRPDITLSIECFHSRDYRPYWFTETKESICIKMEFNSQRFSLGHQHGRHFFVLGHQHGHRDVM